MNDLYAGCLCGFVQTTIGHPFDTVKVLLQNSSISPASTAMSNSSKVKVENSLKNTLLSPRLLYRGITYPFLFNGFLSGATFACNDFLIQQKYFTNNYQTGYVTGILGSILTTPVDLQKVRAQSAPIAKLSEKLCLRSNVRFSQTLLQQHFFRGFVPTFHRETISSSIYFGTYGMLQNKRDSNPLLHGGFSGVLSWLCTYPLDTIKTRIQSGSAQTMKEAFYCGKVWQGIVPCLVRSFIVNACGFYAYEWLR